MFKRLLNECSISLNLKPEGALLIKSGLTQISEVNMAWVRVIRNGRSEVYLPGSSLKGMIRAHSERIARTINETAACDPFGSKGKNASCSQALDKMKKNLTVQPVYARSIDASNLPGDIITKETEPEANQPGKKKNKPGEKDIDTRTAYSRSCPICRLFGNTYVMGRLATEDAYVEGDLPEIQQRDGIGIDRFTGGASHGAKFELEVITGGNFKTTLHLQNFELWQLGLLGFVLQDLKDGLVRLGAGKSRGLGKIKAEVGDVTLHLLGLSETKKLVENGQGKIFGVGELFSEAEAYGMITEDWVEFNPAQALAAESRFPGLRQTIVLPADAIPWNALAEKWVDRAKNLTDGLSAFRSGGKETW